MDAFIRTQALRVYFPLRAGLMRRRGFVHAVDDVDLHIKRGETVGLVGESGCGKTTLGRAILRLIDSTGGQIFFNGLDITMLRGKELRALRREMQMVFQDPFFSLDPRFTIGDSVGEGLAIHKLCKRHERSERVLELLHRVGLSEEHLQRYPHELSGGQKQRVAIARALAVDAKFIVLDECTSALDVSVQSQLLNLLLDLQRELALTYLFISHDIGVVNRMSDTLVLMYLGKAVESGPTNEVLRNPLHPYTKALLASIPVPDPKAAKISAVLTGEPPSPVNPPSGCRFRTRCVLAKERCEKEAPALTDVHDGHYVACHMIQSDQVA